ncbi:hypothetical protein CSUI_005777 [Cystoisospora suis]|uniref:Transmembrane protein n=1 Tax=Cystoisospora suis TaxID=483139 RepID=A0A2C6KU14_9APIC|nr:hypothetical protein CSUI_005777 [Cystoisospora suis]
MSSFLSYVGPSFSCVGFPVVLFQLPSFLSSFSYVAVSCVSRCLRFVRDLGF